MNRTANAVAAVTVLALVQASCANTDEPLDDEPASAEGEQALGLQMQAMQSRDRPSPQQVVMDCYEGCHEECVGTDDCRDECLTRCAPKGGWYQCHMQDNSGNRGICIVGTSAWWLSCGAICLLLDTTGESDCWDACSFLKKKMACPDAQICV